ncbi:MAG: hypothetical protein EZS28_046469, partial [Streblomastix strix]
MESVMDFGIIPEVIIIGQDIVADLDIVEKSNIKQVINTTDLEHMVISIGEQFKDQHMHLELELEKLGDQHFDLL